MSLLKEKLNKDLKESMKAGDSIRVETLRMILSGIQNREIEKRRKGKEEIIDSEVMEVIRKEAKKRKEAIEIYSKAGRNDLKDKESSELNIIQVYLPPELNEIAIEKIVQETIKGGVKDFGGIMKIVMKEVDGRASAGLVSKIVKNLL